MNEGDKVVFEGKSGTILSRNVIYSEGVGLVEYCIRFDGSRDNEYINYLQSHKVKKLEETYVH